MEDVALSKQNKSSELVQSIKTCRLVLQIINLCEMEDFTLRD